jgi:hypothetical protein
MAEIKSFQLMTVRWRTPTVTLADTFLQLHLARIIVISKKLIWHSDCDNWR